MLLFRKPKRFFDSMYFHGYLLDAVKNFFYLAGFFWRGGDIEHLGVFASFYSFEVIVNNAVIALSAFNMVFYFTCDVIIADSNNAIGNFVKVCP